MSNMSYCRFQNTAQDLADCEDVLDAFLAEECDVLSADELKAAERLVMLCLQVASKVAGAAEGFGLVMIRSAEELVDLQPSVVRETLAKAQEGCNGAKVEEAFACPFCDEQRADMLELNEDQTAAKCANCGNDYEIGE